MADKQRIGFIGAGLMGHGMAKNIVEKGYPLTVLGHRNRQPIDDLIGRGAREAKTPKDLAQQSDIVITCVSDTPDVEAVVLGEEGVIQGAKAGAVVVDLSTISPRPRAGWPRACHERHPHARCAGLRRLRRAPEAGPEHRSAKRRTFKAMPVLRAMGKSITHVGPTGAGQMTKAINQVVAGGVYLAVTEGMTLGLKAGLDMEKVVQALAGGAAGSWVLNHRSANMIKNEYPLGFRVRLHRKDVAIAMEAARELGVFLPTTALVEQIENGLISQGYGDEDMSAMARLIRRNSGLE
jgi:3-hydroxyisobutyrate dehydrogenase